MTKYYIISPNGVKVCIIEAQFKCTITGQYTVFYNFPTENNIINLDDIHNWIDSDKINDTTFEQIADIPVGWAAIPLDVIVKEE